MVPLHVWPAYDAFQTILSVPALSAILRSTENEPLRPPVVDEPLAATAPLSLIFQAQLWPEVLLSTSPSTSSFPSSALTLSFQLAVPEHSPVRIYAAVGAAAVAGGGGGSGQGERGRQRGGGYEGDGTDDVHGSSLVVVA